MQKASKSKNEQDIQREKGDDEMQAAIKSDNIALKMQLLKARANTILQDNSLRHTPSEHDVEIISENTKLLHFHQQKTIK